jgi:hypothetical protein
MAFGPQNVERRHAKRDGIYESWIDGRQEHTFCIFFRLENINAWKWEHGSVAG